MDVNIRPKYQEFCYLPVQSGIWSYVEYSIYTKKRKFWLGFGSLISDVQCFCDQTQTLVEAVTGTPL